jgi:transposase-like protein
MTETPTKTRTITAAQRGQIIQRVLVDGWSPGQAAAAVGVGERQLIRWVAAYKRHGMSSLRGDLSTESAPYRWVRRLRAGLARSFTAFRGEYGNTPSASCVPLRRGGDHGRHLR